MSRGNGGYLPSMSHTLARGPGTGLSLEGWALVYPVCKTSTIQHPGCLARQEGSGLVSPLQMLTPEL